MAAFGGHEGVQLVGAGAQAFCILDFGASVSSTELAGAVGERLWMLCHGHDRASETKIALGFLQVTHDHDGIDQDDAEDDGSVHPVLEIAGDAGGEEQEVEDRIVELQQEACEPTPAWLRCIDT